MYYMNVKVVKEYDVFSSNDVVEGMLEVFSLQISYSVPWEN